MASPLAEGWIYATVPIEEHRDRAASASQPSVRENLISCTVCRKNSDEQAIKRLHILGREPARVTTRKALSTTFPKPLWIPGGYGVLGPQLPEGL